MRDIQQLNDKYVIFLPRKQSLNVIYIKFQNVYIRFACSDISYAREVYSSYYIAETINREEEIIASISVIIDGNIFPRKYDYENYDDSLFTEKDHPMYMDDVYNEVIESGEVKVYKYHYPNQSVHIFNRADNSFVSVVSNARDAIKYAKLAIKQVLSEYLIRKDIYPIHAAAVSKAGRGYLFVSGSHTGKTTLYRNLICNGFLPVNDDIVFWKREEEKIALIPCPILPQDRNKSKKDLRMSDMYRNNYENLFDQKADGWPVLESVFFLSLGGACTSFKNFKNDEHVRRYLRACGIHYPISVCEEFLDSLKKLVSIPAYSLELSKDYNEIYKSFNEFISRRKQV